VVFSDKKAFYAIDINTENESVVAEGKRPFRLVWSQPDGESVFFIQYDLKRDSWWIFSCEVAPGNKTELFQVTLSEKDWPTNHRVPHSLAISPDGTQLAIATNKELRLMSTSGGEAHIFVRMEDAKVIPCAVGIAWTPDGKSLIYGEAEYPEQRTDLLPPYDDTQLWLADLDGGDPRRIGSPIDGLGHLSLHPDGDKLAYTISSKNQDSTLKGIWALENFLPPLVRTN
jgi:Tol biopolymer transport system component